MNNDINASSTLSSMAHLPSNKCMENQYTARFHKNYTTFLTIRNPDDCDDDSFSPVKLKLVCCILYCVSVHRREYQVKPLKAP